MPQYLDNNGNPVGAAPPPVYLDDSGNPIGNADNLRRAIENRRILAIQSAKSPEQLAYGPEAMSPATPFKKFGGAVYDVAKGTAQTFIPPGSMPVEGESIGAAAKRAFSPETTILHYGAAYRAIKGMVAPLKDAPAAAAGVLEDYKAAFTGDTETLYQKGLAYLNQAPEAAGQVFALEAGGKLAGKVADYRPKTTIPGAGKLAYGGKGVPPEVPTEAKLPPAKGGFEPIQKPAQMETISAARQQLTERIRGNVEETHAAVRSSLDTRWQNMRDKVGEAPADPAKLSQIETDARTSHLATATPDAVAKFDTVMDRVRETGATPEAALEQKVAEGLGYKSAEQARRRVPAQAFDGMVERLKAEGMAEPVGNNFAELQNRFTRLGEELSKGNLPGETFRALKQVREGYGQHMQEIAGQRGMGNELSNLKSDWSQYMEDFRNTDSPVARALSAKDLPVVTRNATGNTYARFAEIMGRNRQHGGNPVLVQELAGLKAREAAVKATKVTKATSVAKKTAAPSRLKIMLGGVAGGVAGTVVGHPVLGYYAGKEAARAYIGRGKK